MKIAYLGPPGTYTEEALSKVYRPDEHELIPCQTVSEVFQVVESGAADKGIVPIENSIEGSVSETLDYFAFESTAIIEKEVTINIHHHLIGLPGAAASDIKRVISHPQALAQCRKTLAKLIRNFISEPAFSTADAVKAVRDYNDPSSAAIGNSFAAELYGLDVLVKDISDYDQNQTRFVIIGKEPAPKTGYDKTSIVCFIGDDRPGMLLEILQEFSYRYINLTKIASRPTKQRFGEYCFFIDMEGHLEDENIKSAIKCLSCKLPALKILGSYRRSV